MVITIGVLELQGGFDLHHKILKKIGINSFGVKVETDFKKIDGLIIPGGESTTLSLLLDTFKLRNAILEFAKSYPIMGTCAGLIMMSKGVDDERVKPLGLLDIIVKRNAYGRQVMSSQEKVIFALNKERNIELFSTFIRAPRIKDYGNDIIIIAKFKDYPVAVFSRNLLGLAFHPEIDGIDIFHRMMFDNYSEFYYKKLKENYAA